MMIMPYMPLSLNLIEEHIYCMVYSSQKYYNSYFFEYSPSESSWKRISDFPGKPRIKTYSFKVGDRVFVGLGTQNNENDFYEFIPGSTEK